MEKTEKERVENFRKSIRNGSAFPTEKQEKKAWERISDREEKEYRKVAKAVKEKKGDWLGKWLEKFSVEGDFWSKEKKEKIKKDNYL